MLILIGVIAAILEVSCEVCQAGGFFIKKYPELYILFIVFISVFMSLWHNTIENRNYTATVLEEENRGEIMG